MYSIYKTKTAKERGVFILSYTCRNDWKMTAKNVDQKLILWKNKYALKFKDKDKI